MSRELFGIEQGVHILAENGDTGVMLLFGAAAPGGSGYPDSAEQGSVYYRTNGEHYQKFAAGTGTDKWRRMANASDLLGIQWRSEKVRALTADVAPSTGGTIDLVAAPFSDDEAPLLTGSDFAVGEYVLFGKGGTPKLMEVTAIATNVLTFTDVAAELALVDQDVFVVRNYLPDSPDSQENQAIVLYNGTDYIKLGDVDWNFATGINLSSGYTPGSGDITTADTVESAIEKLDGNVDALTSSVGVAQGASNMGTYTGTLISDNESAKENIQELETYVEALESPIESNSAAITTIVVLDSMLVDDVECAKWLLTLSLDSAPERKIHVEVFAGHNGNASADATLVDDTAYAKLKFGAAFNYVITVDINGAGVAQVMRLNISASAAITAKATRIDN